MTRLTNTRTTPELPESETMGGKMGGTAFKASRELGLPRVSASWLLASLLAAGGTPAFAQQESPACAPVIARVVALQGTVEVQRAGTANWLGVRRLDTSICAGDRLRTAPSQPRGALRAARDARARGPEHDDHPAAVDGRDCPSSSRRTRSPRSHATSSPAVLATSSRASRSGFASRRHISMQRSKARNSWCSRAARRASSPCSRDRCSSQVPRRGRPQLVTAGQQPASGAPGTPTRFATVVKPAGCGAVGAAVSANQRCGSGDGAASCERKQRCAWAALTRRWRRSIRR